MAATRKTKLLVWVTALALVMACVPSLASPAVPTLDPGAVNTFIAQTVNAAATQTAASRPSLTPSPTITPTVSTETPSPTPTATVIFVLSTPTPLVIPTFTNVPSSGGGGISSQNYSCQVTRVSPANGSTFDPRDDFDTVWTVRNNGQKNWDRNSVDYIYSSGSKIHKISGYDLDENVRVGNSIDLGVDMQAPKDSGNYTTTWTMRAGNKTFCTLTITINVR
jgi:hypothetical protein